MADLGRCIDASAWQLDAALEAGAGEVRSTELDEEPLEADVAGNQVMIATWAVDPDRYMGGVPGTPATVVVQLSLR